MFLVLWGMVFLVPANSQEADSIAQRGSFSVVPFTYVPISDFVVNPFPLFTAPLVQPLSAQHDGQESDEGRKGCRSKESEGDEGEEVSAGSMQTFEQLPGAQKKLQQGTVLS